VAIRWRVGIAAAALLCAASRAFGEFPHRLSRPTVHVRRVGTRLRWRWTEANSLLTVGNLRLAAHTHRPLIAREPRDGMRLFRPRRFTFGNGQEGRLPCFCRERRIGFREAI
jgi:hypothetical protein